VLGPLINPAHPPLALIGVYSPELVLPIAETLRVLGLSACRGGAQRRDG
jgi:anthranilate phosphoribosyltransferase